MEYPIYKIKNNLTEALGWVRNAVDTIEVNIFDDKEPPKPPYDGWINKMMEAFVAITFVLADDTFKKMLDEEEKQYHEKA